MFFDDSTADNSTLIVNGGGSGHPGGYLWFFYGSSGGATRVELFGNGQLDISLHYAPGITIGSLEGDGDVFLGSFNLSIGSNALSTTFSGVIHDGGTNGGAAGSLIKVGSGTLALDGQSTYTGGTTVSEGVLLTNTQGGSATGTGAVQVAAGTFGGSGTIAGAVTIGTGSGSGAFLAPATGTNKQRTLTVQSQLTLNGDSTYTYTFKAKNEKAKTDKVIANGVTINSGATFVFSGTAQGTLTQGLVLTVISNTAATPISGSFSNLSDGAIVSVNGNNLQASYEGGDGNDLTLTVVP